MKQVFFLRGEKRERERKPHRERHCSSSGFGAKISTLLHSGGQDLTQLELVNSLIGILCLARAFMHLALLSWEPP